MRGYDDWKTRVPDDGYRDEHGARSAPPDVCRACRSEVLEGAILTPKGAYCWPCHTRLERSAERRSA